MKHKLLNRKTFYKDLISEIKKARQFVVVDSYLWVNDKVGKRLAKALLEAANRGVKVFIRNDIFGSIFEHTPGKIPFFYDDSYFTKSFWQTVYNCNCGFLTMKNFDRLGYFLYRCKRRPEVKPYGEIHQKMKDHINIEIQNGPFFNHGKLIVVDQSAAYIGGQCISNDFEEWVDYSQKIMDKKTIKKILLKINGTDTFTEEDNVQFINNDGINREWATSIHDFLRGFILTAENDLHIEMVYLGGWYLEAIDEVLKKGINVYLLVPEQADTNQNANMYFLSNLLGRCGKCKNLHVSLYDDGMLHTKGLATKNKVTLGSTNFHSAVGYKQSVNEANIYSRDKKIINPILRRFKSDFKKGKIIKKAKDLPEWDFIKAYIERFSISLNSYVAILYKLPISKTRKKAQDKLKEILLSYI